MRRFPGILVLLMITALGSADGLKVFVDGKPVVFKTARPQVLSGRTLVPLRGIFEAIGANVEYDEANRTIKAKKNNDVVELQFGSPIARKNGAEITLDVKPQIFAGTTMVPLRFIAEALGAKVVYDRPSATINIRTED